jgi:hypothetical protein
MKIGCVCITARRSPIVGIAVSSFLSQSYENRVLYIGADDTAKYYDEIARLAPEGNGKSLGDWGIALVRRRFNDVSNELHDLSLQAFNQGCDVVTIWDDDDYSPPLRLAATVETFHCGEKHNVAAVSYNGGYFVNLRTLHGKYVKLPHLWGGCLSFTQETFETAGGFLNRECPGYDRSFVEDACDTPYKTVGKIYGKCEPSMDTRPTAFCHGSNIATFTTGDLEPMEDRLQKWMPAKVFGEVKRAQKFLIDRRIFPPGS